MRDSYRCKISLILISFSSPDTVSDLDEKSAEEKEAEADGSKPPEDPSDFLRKEGESPRDFAIRIWQRVFCKDIENVLSMEVCTLFMDVILIKPTIWGNMSLVLGYPHSQSASKQKYVLNYFQMKKVCVNYLVLFLTTDFE